MVRFIAEVSSVAIAETPEPVASILPVCSAEVSVIVISTAFFT